MKVYELRNILDLLDGDANIVVAVKDENYKSIDAYEIKNVGPDPYFEDKQDDSMPVTIWLGDVR